MFKAICIVDKERTALDRLGKGVSRYHENLEYKVIAVHPKRPSPEELAEFEKEARTADVIDYQYFRTAEMLRAKYDWLREIPSILTHNNPYSIKESDWSSYQAVVANNKTILDDLQKIYIGRLEYITLAVDPYFWKYNIEYNAPNSVIMVANRIESKKGILPVALACKGLDLKMYLVGNISDINYFNEVMATQSVEYAQNISDEELRELYYKSGIHICNSVDNFESGTLPILEAMFCGVPVISRKVGHVPDFASEDNIVINHNDPDNVVALTSLIKNLIYDKKKLNKLRNEAWFSIKDKTYQRRAYSYQKLYRELLPEEPVSVIIPVADKEDITRKCLNAVSEQTYKNIEIIVVDDGTQPQEKVIKDYANVVSYPVRYIRISGEGYNLAEARNRAVIEATSDIIVFCDQRMIMQDKAIENFVVKLKPKSWLFGDKGANKTEFVENFSCIYRNDLVGLGPFNERIRQYGGMTQDIRSRARRNGYNLEYVEEAKATPANKSSNRFNKRYEVMESKDLLWKLGLN